MDLLGASGGVLQRKAFPHFQCSYSPLLCGFSNRHVGNFRVSFPTLKQHPVELLSVILWCVARASFLDCSIALSTPARRMLFLGVEMRWVLDEL